MTTLFQTSRISRKIIEIAACLVMGAASEASAETMTGMVVGVADGDTVTVLVNGHDQIRVRIMGIDAPEKKQAFGQRSKQAMSDCAFGKQTRVEWSKKDRYGRTVGKVSVDDVDCGLHQIELGLAWHYKAYKREQKPEDRKSYAEAEAIARSADRGLWSEHDPIPPWDFRHRQPSRFKTPTASETAGDRPFAP